jgi:hypothetical protein
MQYNIKADENASMNQQKENDLSFSSGHRKDNSVAKSSF